MFEDVKELLLETLKGTFSKDKKRNRRIVFWYDEKKEYSEFIDELEIENTEIIKYDNNSFWIRYYIEHEKKDKNIIIYFPFARLRGMDNELLDLETSNSDLLFNPDSTTMLLKNLGLGEECRNVIKKYGKFFNNKKREVEFKQFDIEKTVDNIDYVITAILLNLKTINEDDILKGVIRYYYDQKKYDELFKYGNEEFILNLFNSYFGCFISNNSELPEVLKSLVFTYFATSIKDIKKVSRYSKYILNSKATNVYVFVNSLMRDKTTKKYFEMISKEVEKEFGIQELISIMDIDEYKLSDAFKMVDEYIIRYLVDKLLAGIGEYSIYREYIDIRQSEYWYEEFINEYNLLKVSTDFFEKIGKIENTIRVVEIDTFVKLYTNVLCDIDTLYRKFYYYLDSIRDKDIFIDLKNRIENVYVHNFISELSIKWSDAIEIMPSYNSSSIVMQNKFYETYIAPYNDRKDRIIVIISDAFRYECAKELNARLKKISNKTDIGYMLGVVPSYTGLGMAALLPNCELKRDKRNNENILVDGCASATIRDRELILQKSNPDSIALKYNELYETTKLEWKKIFSGKKIVYIYHNTVDNIGEHSEDRSPQACEDTMVELERLVKDLHTTFSGVNVFITADHGFFYRRSRLENFEKTKKEAESTKQKTRYAYLQEASTEEGIISINLDYIFGKDSGFVAIPRGNTVYARQGGGVNYVHEGILPHEVVIPVINFKSTRTTEESKKVGITYSGLSIKITNAVTYLEFLQDTKVDDNNRPCRYLLHFEDEDANRVSDECTIVANYENAEVKNRFFREKFVFKNIKYDKNKSYFLVIIDEETGKVVSKTKFYIDIAFLDMI